MRPIRSLFHCAGLTGCGRLFSTILLLAAVLVSVSTTVGISPAHAQTCGPIVISGNTGTETCTVNGIPISVTCNFLTNTCVGTTPCGTTAPFAPGQIPTPPASCAGASSNAKLGQTAIQAS